MKLSRSLITTLIIVGVIVILIVSSVGIYNKLVSLEEGVNGQWANVENQYQRRSDLIPNLVNTVKGVANFEQQTLTDVIKARSEATSVKIDPTNLNSEAIQKFQKAQDGLSSALSRLLVVVEKYPELKATQNFLELQSQLEGTENRIAVERRKFNETAQQYNANIRKFPKNIFASVFGFDKKAYFEAQEGAEKTPEVKF